ncbi:translation elongation factor 2 (EF-2/EF-G) [Pontibacter ummariensis]|uniref:Elongation factor G n=1 Tax=Pontibacter ummariensis TaxID=1610492 RepID=A0A239F613_9BACT|nr:elongation factor G [Pontibacter ummariensis]PRY12413.1 translation elongation factor 2 (EF-2/EF-G) [Pontibacter ummariensis]SNS52245.1 translation elongation factor 2 (EF-2/EF-G) [Pontibacter ummariensis]
MKTYDEKHIKNVALLGPAKSGKTTLAETMLFEAGIINRRGTVEEHNTVSDYHEVEHERGSSVYATSLHTEWRDYKINLMDTPGLDDFVGEVISSIRVCDTAVLLLNAQNGVEVGTELLWSYVDRYKKPTILAVNQLDSGRASFKQTIEEAKLFFGPAVTIMQYPVNTGLGFDSIVDLLKMVLYKFPEEGGKPEKLPIPDSEQERANALHNELVEKAAENDEGLMEKYFEKGTLDEDEMRQGLKIGMMKHEVFPVFCLSAKKDMGSGRMMGFIDNVAPSATEMPPEGTEDGQEVPCDPQAPTRLFFFKTLIEPRLGRLSFFKVLAGEVTTGMELQNEKTNTVERIGQLFITDGKNRNPVECLKAGDIGCTLKLRNTYTNHTLNGKEATGSIEPIQFPDPKWRVAVTAVNRQDEEKLGEVLSEIHMEDPTVEVSYDQELKQLILATQGELHLMVTKWRLEHVYKMQVEFQKVKVPYRETIQRAATATYRHKKQSGGAGQFGEVSLQVEPYYEGMPPLKEHPVRETETIDLPWGGKLVFNNCIVGGVIDGRFLPSILKGVMEKMEQGPLTGSYVRDVRVSVFDGKMHPVDSNDISFKIAGMMAFREAFMQAEPLLLEPVQELEVRVPLSLLGDMMTELQIRRGIILNMEMEQDYQVIRARAPLAELDKLLASIRNLSQGRAIVRSHFAAYAPVPADMQKSISAEHGKTEMAEAH